MKSLWQSLTSRFDALMLRERLLVLFAAVVCTALIYDTLAIRPLELRKKRLEQQIAEARQQIRVADAVMTAQQSAPDPAAVKRSYRDALRKQLADIDESMKGLQRGLVPPERMAKLLEEVLSGSRGLQLVAMRTLPSREFEAPGAGPAAGKGAKNGKAAPRDPERTVYQHSVELTLQGGFGDLHNFLAQLEKLPWQMFWGRLVVNAEEHPRLRVTLTVQTLSLSKAWLIV